MFGIGGQEMVIIGLLVLVIFGPSSLPRMARDLGRFVNEARRSIDEFKEELTSVEDEDDKKSRKRSRRDRDADEPEGKLNGKSDGNPDHDEHDL